VQSDTVYGAAAHLHNEAATVPIKLEGHQIDAIWERSSEVWVRSAKSALAKEWNNC
jgi:hypothetical protein